jgi:hypothetical protein
VRLARPVGQKPHLFLWDNSPPPLASQVNTGEKVEDLNGGIPVTEMDRLLERMRNLLDIRSAASDPVKVRFYLDLADQSLARLKALPK